jgi:hypothetical protein
MSTPLWERQIPKDAEQIELRAYVTLGWHRIVWDVTGLLRSFGQTLMLMHQMFFI